MTDPDTRFDVFLSHNSADKPAVEALGQRLLAVGIRSWLDSWNLIPGDPWEEAIEQALDACATCAVFLGPSGIGPWHNEEMRVALDRRARDRTRSFRVIPVLLPGADPANQTTLPRFLSRMSWVDCRSGLDDPEAFRRLVAGIRGVAPGPGASTSSTVATPPPGSASTQKAPTAGERQRLEAELNRLQTQYDTWTRRITAVDTDIGRTLGSLEKQVLEERRAELVAERSGVIAEIERIEQQLTHPEVSISYSPEGDLAKLYARAQRTMDDGNWAEAVRLLGEIAVQAPDYRSTIDLLAIAQHNQAATAIQPTPQDHLFVLKRKSLESQLAAVEKDYEAASRQIEYTGNEVDRLRIARQLATLEQEIADLKRQLRPGWEMHSGPNDSRAVRQERVLDAAIAQHIPVNTLTELIAQVRLPESGGLRAILTTRSYTPSSEDAVSQSFDLEFPLDDQGQPTQASLVLKLESPDFIPQTQSKRIPIPTNGDSPEVLFLLAPQRVGKLVINVEVFREDELAASRLLRTESGPPENTAQVAPTYFLISMPLTVVALANLRHDRRTEPRSWRAILRDPMWQAIGAIVGVVALFVASGAWLWPETRQLFLHPTVTPMYAIPSPTVTHTPTWLPTTLPPLDIFSPTPSRGVTMTPTPKAIEGIKLYLRDQLLSTEPAAGNTSARFECHGACDYAWPMTLTVPFNALSYGYRLDISGRFNLKLTLMHGGSTSVLVDARRLAAGMPALGAIGGLPLAGVPGDVLTLELNLPDGGQIIAHQSGGGLVDDLFGGGGSGSASFITLSQAEPPPTPSPAPPVAARLAANRGASNGPAIAAGPDDTLHVAWAATSEGSPAIFYARSSDGGMTFSSPVTVVRGPDAAARGAPTIAGNPKGAVVVAWEEKRDGAWGIAYSRSTDGRSFSAPILMGGPAADGDREQPTLASALDGTLYLAWRELRVGQNGGIYFARAAAGGDFGPEMPVSPFPEFQGNPVLAADKGGRVHLAWTDRRDGPVAVYYTRADDGATFEVARRISDNDNHTPSLALDKDGSLHLAWASKFVYVYHTHYTASKDDGDSFSQEVMLNDGGASVSVSAPLTAIAAGTDGTVYVAFLTSSPRDGTVLHYDRAKNGAFGRDMTVAGAKDSPAPGQPAMTSDSRGRVFLVWSENAAGSLQVYLARAEAGGDFSPGRKVIGGSTGIAPADGKIKTASSGLTRRISVGSTW